jgi:hypothetical protein
VRPRNLVLLAGLVGVLISSASAGAKPRGYGSPPPTRLRTDAGLQRGYLTHSDWTDRDGDVCISGSGIGTGTFPRKALSAPGGHARIVFRNPFQPKRVRVRAWREVDDNGEPAGDAEEIAVELKPGVAPSGKVQRWRAVFSVDPAPDYYLRMYARWHPEPVCGGSREELKTYHLTVPGEPAR